MKDGPVSIRRYDVYLANLQPVIGAEIDKTRPVVVVSQNEMNRNLSTVVVCPLTSTIHPGWRSRIEVTFGGQKSEIAVDQIRTLSTLRLKKKIGEISAEDGLKVRLLISEMYGEPV